MGHRTIKRKGRPAKKSRPSRRRRQTLRHKSRRLVGGRDCIRVRGTTKDGNINDYWVHHAEKDVAGYKTEDNCNQDNATDALVKDDLIRQLLFDKLFDKEGEHFQNSYYHNPERFEKVIALIVHRLNSCALKGKSRKEKRKIINNEFESILGITNNSVEIMEKNYNDNAFEGIKCKTDSNNFGRKFKNNWNNFGSNTSGNTSGNTNRNFEEFKHQLGKMPSRIQNFLTKSQRVKTVDKKPSFTPYVTDDNTWQRNQEKTVDFRNPPPFNYDDDYTSEPATEFGPKPEPDFGRNPDSSARYYNPIPNKTAKLRLLELRPPPKYDISSYLNNRYR